MVKGISRQVIVLHAPDQKLFEQAIFILKDEALRSGGVTDDDLLKEAKRLMNQQSSAPRRGLLACGPIWGLLGAAVTAAVWGLFLLF